MPFDIVRASCAVFEVMTDDVDVDGEVFGKGVEDGIALWVLLLFFTNCRF